MRDQSVLLSAGSNSGGQLGLGHGEDAHVLQVCQSEHDSFPPAGMEMVCLASGSNHAVAVVRPRGCRTGKQLWASGCGRQGQLGKRIESVNRFQRLDLQLDLALDGEMESQWEPVQAACGWNSTFVVLRRHSSCSIDDDDMFLVLGRDNDFGQLGTGESRRSKETISRIHMPQPHAKCGPMRISDIACGLRHAVVSCNVVQNGVDGVEQHWARLYGWGAARHGQLDTCADRAPPTVHWHPHLIDEWQCVGGMEGGRSTLGAGKEHTVYHVSDALDVHRRGTLATLGSNRQGQRQVASAVKADVSRIAVTWNATLVQLLSGEIVGSGNNSKGQLGTAVEQDGVFRADLAILGETRRVEALVCGSEHTLVLVNGSESNCEVWGWGWNEHGNLAQDDEEDRVMPVRVWPPNGVAPVQGGEARHVWAGCGTTFVEVIV